MPFVKGDPRINRKGRPKSFDALRKLAQSLAVEPAKDAHGQAIVIDGHVATNVEMIMREWLREKQKEFVEVAFGKVPMPIDLKVTDADIDRAIEAELARLAASGKAEDVSAAEGQADSQLAPAPDAAPGAEPDHRGA